MKIKLPAIITTHPRLTTWAILALGMVIMLLWESRDVGLHRSQLAFLVLMTVLLAGACAWMIGWGDDEADDDGFDPAPAEKKPTGAATEESSSAVPEPALDSELPGTAVASPSQEDTTPVAGTPPSTTLTTTPRKGKKIK